MEALFTKKKKMWKLNVQYDVKKNGAYIQRENDRSNKSRFKGKRFGGFSPI